MTETHIGGPSLLLSPPSDPHQLSHATHDRVWDFVRKRKLGNDEDSIEKLSVSVLIP